MLSYMAHCFIDAMFGAMVFYFLGFGLMFGGSKLAPGLENGSSIFGCDGFMLLGRSYDVQTIMLWLFQMVFATKEVSIIAGAVAERLKFGAYLTYSFFVCGIIYPIYGHWVWGGGWLSTLPLALSKRLRLAAPASIQLEVFLHLLCMGAWTKKGGNIIQTVRQTQSLVIIWCLL